MTRKKISDTQRHTAEEFLAYRSTIGKMVGRIVNPGDVDDILQDSFIRVFEASRNREIEHTRAYLYKTARNLALNFIARKANYLVDSVEDISATEVITDGGNTESRVESREKFQLFCRAVADLPPQCRKAFLLKRVYGYSLRDIARVLKISESTAEKHVAKGVLRCADFLRDTGYPVIMKTKGKTKRKIKT